jgi:hypothetical protein
MENKDLTAGEREAIFILKNKNKTYAEFAKLLKIYRSSVYYTLKNFGPTPFSPHKNQSSRRKTTKNDNRIVIKSKQNRHSNCIRYYFGDRPEPADVRRIRSFKNINNFQKFLQFSGISGDLRYFKNFGNLSGILEISIRNFQYFLDVF